MNLKNYTSSVPVETTIMRIEQYLIATGLVTGIGKEYKDSTVQSIIFHICYEDGKLPMTIKLGASVDECVDFFWREHLRTAVRNRKVREDFNDQGARTAWKLQEDWVRVETSLILLKQRTVLQSFIAHQWDGERTFYQRIVDSKYKMLASPKSE